MRVITDESDVRVKQIIENDQRADVSPLEQARSYQALMDSAGWTVDQLAAKIGKSPHRITERTILLRLPSEYQTLLAAGTSSRGRGLLEADQAHANRARTTLFDLIRAGSCRSYNDLGRPRTRWCRPTANELPATDAARRRRKGRTGRRAGVRDNSSKVADLLRNGIAENQIIAVKKVDPHRAATMADLIAVMQKDLRRIEVALREAAVQQSFLTAA